MKHIHIILLAVVFLCGCSAFKARELVPFSEGEFNIFNGTGKAVIEGQGFARTRGGEVRYAAGSDVFLVPATSHTRDWINSGQWYTYFGSRITLGFDPRTHRYVKRSVCDGEGRFTFEDLVPGPYFVVTKVVWYAGDSEQFVPLHAQGVAREDRTTKVVLR